LLRRGAGTSEGGVPSGATPEETRKASEKGDAEPSYINIGHTGELDHKTKRGNKPDTLLSVLGRNGSACDGGKGTTYQSLSAEGEGEEKSSCQL